MADKPKSIFRPVIAYDGHTGDKNKRWTAIIGPAKEHDVPLDFYEDSARRPGLLLQSMKEHADHMIEEWTKFKDVVDYCAEVLRGKRKP